MFLTIDIGNTLQKATVYNDEGLEKAHLRQATISKNDWQRLLEDYPIDYAILSNVGTPDIKIEELIKPHCPLIKLDSTTPLPIAINYGTHDTLGSDRIANAVGANRLFRNQPVLSIQAGSCLVYDFINEKNEYCGGSISPGIDMRLKALNHFTQKLPKVEKQLPQKLIGASTEESILSGIIYGVQYEIEGFIKHYRNKYPQLNVILTGGDVDALQNSINFTIFAAPNIVSLGLYEILKFNVERQRIH